MSGRFDPSRYAQVKDRLPLFWENYPAGRITTEIYALSEDWTRVIIKASVYRDVDEAEPTATGFAEETQTPNGGGANRNSHIENCETSAIGRALANFKFQGGIERPSREEMEKAQRVGTANAGFEEGQRVVDAPRNTPAPRPTPRQTPQEPQDAAETTTIQERTIAEAWDVASEAQPYPAVVNHLRQLQADASPDQWTAIKRALAAIKAKHYAEKEA